MTDLPHNWAQPMIDIEFWLGSANRFAEVEDYRSAIDRLERMELAIARAKKAMEQARETK